MARIFISMFLLMFVGISCKKDSLNSQLGIPYYKVDQYILLNNPTSIGLNSVGGFMYYTGGSKGLLIYHRTYDEYVAFDRHCTWQTEKACAVSVDSSTTVILNCSCCNSKFSLIDGSVLNGPATYGLLQYHAQLSDAYTLHIYN